MDTVSLLVIVLVGLFVVFKLGLLKPVAELAAVATRESTVYNREHKAEVAKRYATMMVDVDVAKVNANIAAIDALHFD